MTLTRASSSSSFSIVTKTRGAEGFPCSSSRASRSIDSKSPTEFKLQPALRLRNRYFEHADAFPHSGTSHRQACKNRAKCSFLALNGRSVGWDALPVPVGGWGQTPSDGGLGFGA